MGQPDGLVVDAPQHGDPRPAATMLEMAVKAVWAAMPADVSLLHLLFYIHSAGKLDLLLDTEGGAQQDRFVEGARNLAATRRRDARRRWSLSAPVRRIEYGRRTACTRARRQASSVRARARDRRGAPDAGRPDRVRPAAAGLPRPAHAAVPDGRRDQVPGVLRRAVLARRGAERAAPSASTGPLTMIFDNSPPDGSPGILVGFLEGHWARELGRVSSEPSAATAVIGEPGAALRPARRAAGAITSSKTGPTRSGAAAATWATRRPEC